MKILIFCSLVCFLFPTLVAKETQAISFIAPRDEVISQSDNKKLVQDFFTAMTIRDLKTISSLLSLDYTVQSLNHQSLAAPSKYDAFSKNLDVRIKALHDAFPNFKIHVIEIISEGKKVVAVVQLTGVQKGSFLGLEASGKDVTINMTSLFTIESGKIFEIQEMWNELDVMKQLGYILLR